MHIHAAVDADGLAGHEVAVIGGEKYNRADEIRRVLIALEGGRERGQIDPSWSFALFR